MHIVNEKWCPLLLVCYFLCLFGLTSAMTPLYGEEEAPSRFSWSTYRMGWQAEALEKEGKYEEAIELYNQLSHTFPHNEKIWFHLGRLYFLIHQNENAIYALQRCIEEKPRDWDAHVVLANVYLSEKDFVISQALFEEIVVHKPHNADALVGLGRLQAFLGNYKEAELFYRKALKEQPHYRLALESLAAVLITQGQYTEAQKIYSSLQEVYPQDLTYQKALNYLRDKQEMPQEFNELDTRFNTKRPLRKAYLQNMDLVKTRAFFEEVAQKWDFPEVLLALGEINALLNNVPEAIALYEKALEVEPNCKEALEALGIIYLVSGKYTEAEICYGKLHQNEYLKEVATISSQEDKPTPFSFLHNMYVRAQFFEQKKKYALAILLYERLHYLYPGDTEFLIRLGKIYSLLHEYDKSRNVLEQALQINPIQNDALLLYAYSYYFEKDLDQSKKIFQEILIIDPRYNEALVGLGQVEVLLDHPETAHALFEQALEIKPDDENTRYQLAQLEYSQNQFSPAEKAYATLATEFPSSFYSYRLFRTQEYINPSIALGGSKSQEKQKEIDGSKWNARLNHVEKYVQGRAPLNDQIRLRIEGKEIQEAQDDLLTKTVLYSSKIYKLGIRGEWFWTPSWSFFADLTYAQASNNKHHVTLRTKRAHQLQPSIGAEYRHRGHRFKIAELSDTMMSKLFKQSKAEALFRTRYYASYEKAFGKNRFLGAEADYILYHDVHHNNEKDFSLWAQCGIPKIERFVALRYQYYQRKFKKEVDDYYSFKHERTQWLIAQITANWNEETRFELNLGHAWRLTTYTHFVQQLSTGPITASSASSKKRQKLRINTAQAIFTKILGLHWECKVIGEYSRDSTDYTTWALKLSIAYQF